MPLTLRVLLACLLALSPRAFAGDAILRVRASVATAEVFLDGKALGVVPVTAMVSPGPHSLRVVADNFDPYVRRVEAEEGKALDVSAALTPGGGTVEFAGVAGARLTLDGTDRGPLPLRLPALTPGTHTWKVAAPRYEPESGTFAFTPGKNLYFDVKQLSSAGIFMVTTTPPGAAVTLDGKPVGVTPLRLTDIPAGVHAVDIQIGGRARVLRSVDTSDGSRGEITLTLPNKGGGVKVSTGDATAKILINDVEVSTTGSVRMSSVEPGRLAIRVESGGAPVQITKTLSEGETVDLMLVDGALVERPALVKRWAFWAAVGGGAAVVAGGAAVVAVAAAPEPPPTGDVVEVLP